MSMIRSENRFPLFRIMLLKETRGRLPSGQYWGWAAASMRLAGREIAAAIGALYLI
jgi:hypothetical protein